MTNIQVFSLCYTLLGAATAVWVVYWLGESNSGWGVVRTAVAYVIVCVLVAAFWPVVVGTIIGLKVSARRRGQARERYARERQATALRIWDEQTAWHKAHRKDGWDR